MERLLVSAYRPHAARSLLSRLASALAHQRQRSRLAQLEAHMLNDIGVSRQEALREANRPIWDAPDNWRI